MGWKNLTVGTVPFEHLGLCLLLYDSLRFRPQNYIPDPFLKDIEPLVTRQLPAWLEPASALISLGGGTFFLLFGGHIRDVGPTSDMIAIDLDLLTWWFVDVQGAPIRPRMSACMVAAVDNKIFIFGGCDKFEENSPASPIRTYSVAQYTPQTRWTWQTADQPFPPDLPLLGYSIQATPVYGGQKIILTQGRVDDSPLDVSRESTIFFHTQNHTFQDAQTTMGNFPRGIAWYNLGSVVAGAVRPSAPPTPRRRGRPPRNPPPEIAAPAVPTMPTYNFLPSVIIVAWIKHSAQDDDLVPEAWPPPAERIRCLNLREKIYDLDLDLQSFVAVGNRLFLLGSGESRDAVDAQNDDMEVDKPIPAWDVAVEISSKYLLE